MLVLTGLVLAGAGGVLGKVVSVDVGNGGLVFSPETIVAEKGDQVQFTFYPTVSLGFPSCGSYLPCHRVAVELEPDCSLSNRATLSRKLPSIARVRRMGGLTLGSSMWARAVRYS
jgi:hypothetical protein